VVTTSAEKQLRIYDQDGSILLPHIEVKAFSQHERDLWKSVMNRNQNPLHCRRSDRARTDEFENLGDKIARNPVLQLLGMGNPYREELANARKLAADASCDGE
jgi:hypothetical protein